MSLSTLSNEGIPNNSLLLYALHAAIAAGGEILRIYRNPSADLQLQTKQDDTPLTAADLAAQKAIDDLLSKTGIPILSEEGQHLPYVKRRQWQHFWLTDPLDGTKEFLNRNGEFTVNIALVDHTRPVMGVIYVPVHDTLYFGAVGMGAYRLNDGSRVVSGAPQTEADRQGHAGELKAAGGQPDTKGQDHRPDGEGERSETDTHGQTEYILLKANRLPDKVPDGIYTLAGSRSHMNDLTRDYFVRMKEEHGQVRIVSAGSSLKMCLVAEGSAHSYPRFGPTMEWDTAAGQAIVEAAGKTVTVAGSKEPLRYNKEQLNNPHFIVQ